VVSFQQMWQWKKSETSLAHINKSSA